MRDRLDAPLEARILDPKDTATLPSSSRLESVALQLHARRDWRMLVAMVERWSQVAEPTSRARLAQIEAFLHLCMMDRAWTRLQGMEPNDGHQVDYLTLTARMFVDRGWPKRARAALEQAVELAPSDPRIDALRERAAQPPRRAPSQLPEADADLDHQLEAAELFLSTGAYLKGKQLLSRLEAQHPLDDRAAALRWALAGDYELVDTDLPRLADSLAPMTPMGTWEHPETTGEDEHTESIDLHATLGGGSEHAEHDTGGFAGLFRGDTSGGTDPAFGGDQEVTQTTSIDELRALPGTAFDDPDEDTQVLRIVGLDHMPGEQEAERIPEEPPAYEELEQEDDAVVIITRRRELTVPAPPVPSLTPMVAPKGNPMPSLDTTEVRRRPSVVPQSRAPATDFRIWWIVLATVLLATAAVLALIAAVLLTR